MEELPVFLERRTAAGGVDDVHVGAAAFERRDVAFGELAAAIHLAGVDRDRAAAALIARHDDLDPARASSTRTDASFQSANATCMMQPAWKNAVARRGPAAGKR